MRKLRHTLSPVLGAGMLLGLFGLQGCTDPTDISSTPIAKLNKEEFQKAQFEKDKEAAAAKRAAKKH